MPEGRIMKALSGFYYCMSDGKIYTCKGRGVFRKKKITPLCGDDVIFDVTSNKEGYITEILKRNNELIRPPVANVTQGMIVQSIVEPDFSAVLMDRFIVLLESKQIKPVLILSKRDLASSSTMLGIERIVAYYKDIGYAIFVIDITNDLPQQIMDLLKDEVTVLAGQSGAGKSTFLNKLNPSLELETKAISNRLGRGKHTTRHVELFPVAGGLVADTPGFSSLDFPDMTVEELADCFTEFQSYKNTCRFRGCLHDKEPHCAVKIAVEEGYIATWRYDHYLKFLQEIKNRKPRY